jgi:hypothetical protein
MFKTVSEHTNYRAKIVRLANIRKHSNADRLQCVSVEGSNVITDLTAKDGDIYVFFPVESTINKEFLSWSNSFEDKTLNADKEVRGFFSAKGRVRAISLRGERSEGYIVPAAKFFDWLSSVDSRAKFSEDMIGTEFDYFNDVKICDKYIVQKKGGASTPKDKKKIKRESKIVDGQFRLTEDTAHFKRNLHKFSPEDVVTIGYKMHGCAAVLSKVLCKRKLTIRDRVAKVFGAKVQETHYDYVFSSRRVIKNGYSDKKHDSFYSTDVWGMMAEKYNHTLKDGISLYGEIVGQMPNGKWVQKEYDYGLSAGVIDFFVFRITYTNAAGEVFEFTTPQVKRYCEKAGLKMVPIFFYGKLKDLYPDLDAENHWHENLLEKMIADYTEKDCFMCRNKLPEEGIVIHKESDFFEPYKLKSFSFVARTTAQNDAEEEDIDDAN